MISRKIKTLLLIGIKVTFCFNVYCQQMTEQEKHIEELIKKMTLQEKVNMLHGNSSFTSAGVPRLGVPELVMSDGPNGVRVEHGRDWVADNAGNDSATALPTGVGLAATWDPELGYQYGKVLGSEARARGKDVILGPAINIHRTPLNGRNYEYMSEDPYLVSKMVVGYVKGVQDQGVAACVKHYLANNQETHRDDIDVEMSERTLREIYLPGFKAAVVEGGVYTLMGAYNKFRGQFCTHNDYLINKVLKGEFGFKGIVMSDWGAVHNSLEPLINGTDLEMGTEMSQNLSNPDYSKFYMGDSSIAYVNKGIVPESLIDDKVRRILWVLHKVNKFGTQTKGSINSKEHKDVARKIAEDAIVLLKNEAMLPLKQETIKSIAVIGANANVKHSEGGGSGQVRPQHEVTALEGIKTFVGNKVNVTYSPGYTVEKNGKANADLIKQAVDAASKAEVAILVGGWVHGYSYMWEGNAYDAESVDKPDLQLPFGQNELFKAVLKANPKTILVLIGGGPMDMSEWNIQAKAIVQAWYGGSEGGTAIANVLFGKVNPSGKLPMTFPKKLTDSPAHKLGEYPGVNKVVHYNEGVFVGYRYFDTYKIVPQYAFGYGLSYTNFAFQNLIVSTVSKKTTVKVTVKNVGKVAGAEVVQLYVKDLQASVQRPEKELKGFKKVYLKPGESKEVDLNLEADAFSFYDEKKKQWVLEPGKFEILLGNSSNNILLKKEITL